ncbi:MAG: response regulator transcription factor [Verrucomicrobia bacterium]|nr:response regulator transcription factor [Verrucomicrobiota bacterium]
MRILILEDDRATVQLLGLPLTSSGHTVVHALDGTEGLKQPRAAPCDLVISDVQMVPMDGPGFSRGRDWSSRASSWCWPRRARTSMSGSSSSLTSPLTSCTSPSESRKCGACWRGPRKLWRCRQRWPAPPRLPRRGRPPLRFPR